MQDCYYENRKRIHSLDLWLLFERLLLSMLQAALIRSRFSNRKQGEPIK